MEDDAVVERRGRRLARLRVRPLASAGGELDEVLDGGRGVVAEQIDLDLAEIGADRRDSGVVSHGSILPQERRRDTAARAGFDDSETA